MSDRATQVGVENALEGKINPATEEKQDDILTQLKSSSRSFIDVTRGLVPGETMIAFGGTNPNMATGAEETIWDQGGIYTYLTADTTLYISSSNASDTNVDVIVTGLDDTYTEITRTVNTNGQNQIALSGDIFRVFSALVSGSIEPLGDLYIAESDSLTNGVPDTDSKIKAKIVNGNNITQMAIYTIPAGKTGYGITSNYVAGKGQNIEFNPTIRYLGGVFLSTGIFDIYQSAIEFTIPSFVFPEKTDLEFRGTAGSTGTIGTTFLDLKLIDN
jgi:hypothetical protein